MVNYQWLNVVSDLYF